MPLRVSLTSNAGCAAATALAMFAISAPLLAQECDPAKFLIENVDLETLDLVAAGQLITTTSQSWNDTRRKSITSAFKTNGDAGSFLFDSARSRARAIVSALNYTYSESEKRTLFSSRLSPAGADAYTKCLDAQQNRLVLELPSSAISSKQFSMKIKWKVGTAEKGSFQLRVSSANGDIDENVRDFGPNEETSLLLRARDRSQNTSIIARVVRKNPDGSSSEVQAGTAEVPPNLQITQRIAPQVADVNAVQPTGRVNIAGIGQHCFIPSRAESVLVERSASFNRIDSKNRWTSSFPVQSEDRVCIKLEAHPNNDSSAFVRGNFFVNELFYERKLLP